MKQGFLFPDDTTQGDLFPFVGLFDDAQAESGACDCSACKGTKLEVVCERTGAHPDGPFTDLRGAFNHCTLEGEPARIIGRSYHYATIKPLDVDAESIHVCWDVVAHVLEVCDGAFVRSDE